MTHPTPEAPSDGLIEAYVPVAIHFEGADTLDFVTRDAPTFSRPVYAGMDVLHDVQNREPIGWRIYGWSRIAPKSEALTQAAARIQVLEAAPFDTPLVERVAYEASQWAKDPAHNIGADPPSLVFARRFAFLMEAATARRKP